MTDVLFVVTSWRGKPERIYTGSHEWTEGWQFPDGKELAVRTKGGALVYLDKLDDLDGKLFATDTIVWIKGREKPDFQKETFNRILNALMDNKCEVYLVYHDEFVYDLVSRRNRELLKSNRRYGLSGNPSQFKNVLREKGGRLYLDAMANFDSLFRSFFLIPSDIFSSIAHKVIGILEPIDIDLQELEERKFSDDYWETMVKAYEVNKPIGKLEECRRVVYDRLFYENEPGLRSLSVDQGEYAVEESRQALITKWGELVKLLPEDQNAELNEVDPLYLKAKGALDALSTPKLDEVKKNIDGFREWFYKLRSTIDQLRITVLEDRRKTTTGTLT